MNAISPPNRMALPSGEHLEVASWKLLAAIRRFGEGEHWLQPNVLNHPNLLFFLNNLSNALTDNLYCSDFLIERLGMVMGRLF